jgi:hypothetical protein
MGLNWVKFNWPKWIRNGDASVLILDAEINELICVKFGICNLQQSSRTNLIMVDNQFSMA